MRNFPYRRVCVLVAAAFFLTLPLGSLAQTPDVSTATAADGTGATGGLERLETVAEFHGPMPTGVTVSSSGRIFVNFPRWGDDVAFTVAEIKDGKPVAYPSQDLNTTPSIDRQADGLVSVQSVVVDPADRLWLLDSGSIRFGPTSPGGPKLVCVDLSTNAVAKTILIPPDVALPTTYLNDVRFDLTRGTEGVAYITDSGLPGALIVVDLGSSRATRRLSGHPTVKPDPGLVTVVEENRLMRQASPDARPEPVKVAADGIALSADGKRLFWCPLTSRKLYSISTDRLLDPRKTDEDLSTEVKEEPGKRGASDGLESDASGNLYLTDYENNAIIRRFPDGTDSELISDARLLWPDTLSVAPDGYLYVIANQLHRQPGFNAGQDKRQRPFFLFRLKTGMAPVALKK